MIPFITPCHQCLHLLHFLENFSLISACSLCPGSLTHHSYLKTGPSTSLSFPPIVHASQLPAKGLLDSCFPLQVEPGVIGYSKSEGPGPLSHLQCRRWRPLLSTTAFSHKKSLTHKILHVVTEGCTSLVVTEDGYLISNGVQRRLPPALS